MRGWDYQSPLVTTSGDRRHGCDSDGLKLLQAPVSEFIVKGARFWWILAYVHKMVFKKTERQVGLRKVPHKANVRLFCCRDSLVGIEDVAGLRVEGLGSKAAFSAYVKLGRNL